MSVVQSLLKHGADLTAKNEFGLTAPDVATFYEEMRVIDILEKAKEDAERGLKPIELNDAEKMIGFVQALRASKQNRASRLQIPVANNALNPGLHTVTITNTTNELRPPVSQKVKGDHSEAQSEERSRKSADSASNCSHSSDKK